MPDIDDRLLLLDAADNVLVARTHVPAGAVLALETARVTLPAPLPIGHKVARHPIRAGEAILKYGARIGSATLDIPAGAHVHVHNVRSDYTPSTVLETEPEQADG